MVQQLQGSVRYTGTKGMVLRGLGAALLSVTATVSATTARAQQLTPQYAISTVAGTGTVGDTGDGGQATKATLGKPVGVTIDKAGNLYISEANTTAGVLTNTIRKITPAGVISTIAGKSGAAGTYTGDGGPSTMATLNNPYGVEIDRDGNLLIGDISNYVIRKIDNATGKISTVVGSHAAGYTGDGGPAISAKVNTAYTAAGDSFGNIYVADANNNVIRKVDPAGTITTFAGTGVAGHSGDGGPAKNAQLSKPYSVWCDPAGNVYINELGTSASYIRLIDTAGIIHTLGGTGTPGYNGDNTPAINAEFNTPHGAVTDGFGTVYIADETNDIVRMIDPSGIITTIAGTGLKAGSSGDGGVGTAALLHLPYGIAIDPANNLFIADVSNYKIRKLSLNTVLPSTNVAASSAVQKLFVKSSAAVTPATATLTPAGEFTLGTLSGCTLGTQLAANAVCTMPITFKPTAAGTRSAQLGITDASGNVSVIGVTGTGTAPAVTFGPGTITTIAGTGTAGYSGTSAPAATSLVSAPRGGMMDGGGNIFFADSGNNVIRRIDAASGAITTVAGTGTAGYAGDGSSATAAQLNAPAKVFVDAADNLYIADTGNSVIRFVSASNGTISTIAGNGTAAYTGDGGAATSASLNHPQGLTVDLGGHVYVADTGNNVIRYFGKGGQISTFAGTGTSGYAGDGSNVMDAQLNAPQAVLLDGHNGVYIVDTGNSVIRFVSTTNTISTIAGIKGTNTNAGDGAPAATASLDTPSDLAMDAAGDLFIAANGLVRMIDGNANISTIAGSNASGAYSGEGDAATNAVLPAPASNLFVDSSANVYVSDTAANRLLEIALATPRTITFGNQTPNTTGSAQRVSVQNVGNANLVLSGLTVTGPFAQQTDDPTSCTSTTSLAPSTSCSLSITFTPTTTGPFTGSITIVDNALNNTSSTQTISLTGTGVLVNNTQTAIALSPVSPVYGQTTAAVATAQLSGSVAATGTVTFTLNGVTLNKVAITGTTASINLPSLLVGSYNLGASYSGDDNNSSSSDTTMVVVQPAVLTVTATDATRYTLYQPNPTFAYTITGFTNGDTSSAVTGAPSITTTATQSSPVGPYPITPVIGTLAAANYTFVFVPAVLTITPAPPPDYTLTVTPNSVEMENGGSATFTFSFTSLYGYTGTVKFGCQAPANVNCQFVPPTLKGDPNNVLTSQLTVYLGSAYASSFGGTRWLACFAALLAASLMLRRRKAAAAITLSIAFFAGACGLSGCGTTVNTLPSKGTSQITITAADGASSLTHSATVTLKID